MTIEELKAQLDELNSLTWSGALKIKFGEREMWLQSTADLLKAKADLADEIAKAEAPVPGVARSMCTFARFNG